RVYPEGGPRNRGRPIAAPARRADQGGRHSGGRPRPQLPGPARAVLPARPSTARRVSRRHAVRGATGGGVPCAGAEELRLHALHRLPPPEFSRPEVARALADGLKEVLA